MSRTFPGFEDTQNDVYIRVVTLPERAYAEIEKSMTREALKQQGLTVDKREAPTVKGRKSVLVRAQQTADGKRIHKWLLIAPIDGLTALVSFEIPDKSQHAYAEAVVRAALLSVDARDTVPTDEQLSLLPFKLGALAGLRLVGVIPGRAAQLTDGPKDLVETVDQAHLVVAIAPGGPPQSSDRDNFARNALGGLPNLKDLRITGSESMRLSGQPGHELRAEAKDATTGIEVEIVQWLRFGNGAYVRFLGFGPKQGWTQAFTKFREVRDGLEPR